MLSGLRCQDAVRGRQGEGREGGRGRKGGREREEGREGEGGRERKGGREGEGGREIEEGREGEGAPDARAKAAEEDRRPRPIPRNPFPGKRDKYTHRQSIMNDTRFAQRGRGCNTTGVTT